jgi:glycosyltransferase involved in cell wall biosynthesis
MKIAIIFGPFSIGERPLDFHFNNIYESTRGLTGSDLSAVEISKNLVKLGHDVSLFTIHAQPDHKPDMWEGSKLYNFEERLTVVDDTFDAILSINEPDVFRGMTTKPFRICWQFLNDFTYCQPNFEEYVDKWLGVCEKHTNHLKAQTSCPEKWDTVPLACSPEIYTDERVPGRVIWCSSADRGLHWLLQEWPEIKKQVPHASLRIFYHFNYGTIENIQPHDKSNHPHVVEMGQRIRYMKETIKRLAPLGVEHVGSVSRNQMKKEFNEASVFGFPCDPVSFSEGFSVSTTEAHASYTVPVISSRDCLGSIYKKSGCLMIDEPVRDNLGTFTSYVVKSLTDKSFSDKIIEQCRTFAERHTWSITAKKIEDILVAGVKK